MPNTNYVSQALRVVRSLEEVKEELRGLTVRVDGQEETVSGLLEAHNDSKSLLRTATLLPPL